MLVTFGTLPVGLDLFGMLGSQAFVELASQLFIGMDWMRNCRWCGLFLGQTANKFLSLHTSKIVILLLACDPHEGALLRDCELLCISCRRVTGRGFQVKFFLIVGATTKQTKAADVCLRPIRTKRETGLAVWFDQSVRLTSNACAPIEEARPSVWPARYITTPFPFVSLACIFPSIRVSPLLMPW